MFPFWKGFMLEYILSRLSFMTAPTELPRGMRKPETFWLLIQSVTALP